MIDSGVRASVVELRTAESREDEAIPQHTACTNRTRGDVRGEKPHRRRTKSTMKEKGEGEDR